MPDVLQRIVAACAAKPFIQDGLAAVLKEHIGDPALKGLLSSPLSAVLSALPKDMRLSAEKRPIGVLLLTCNYVRRELRRHPFLYQAKAADTVAELIRSIHEGTPLPLERMAALSAAPAWASTDEAVSQSGEALYSVLVSSDTRHLSSLMELTLRLEGQDGEAGRAAKLEGLSGILEAALKADSLLFFNRIKLMSTRPPDREADELRVALQKAMLSPHLSLPERWSRVAAAIIAVDVWFDASGKERAKDRASAVEQLLKEWSRAKDLRPVDFLRQGA